MKKMTQVSANAAFVLGQIEGNGIQFIAENLGYSDIDVSRIINSLKYIDQYEKSSNQAVKTFFSRPRTAQLIADLMTACNWLNWYWFNYLKRGEVYFSAYAKEAVDYFSDCYNKMYEYVGCGKVSDAIAAEVFKIIH